MLNVEERALEIWITGHSRSLKMTEVYRPCTTSSQYAIVSIALSCSCTFFKILILTLKNIVTSKFRLGVTHSAPCKHFNRAV